MISLVLTAVFELMYVINLLIAYSEVSPEILSRYR